LIFSSAPLNGRAARELINERANQSTRNDPLRARDVKHGLSRSFPPLLWINARREKFFGIFFERRVAGVVKKQTDELSPALAKNFSSVRTTPIVCAVAQPLQRILRSRHSRIRAQQRSARLPVVLLRSQFTCESSRRKCRRARASARLGARRGL